MDVSENRARDEPPQRKCERVWPIGDHLKSDNADELFSWIGERIAEVVWIGCGELDIPRAGAGVELPMGVAFSFPMEQSSLADATLRGMGKGFAITEGTDLRARLGKGYEAARTPDMPPVKIVAITNDSVATLISFIYSWQETANKKAAMGLICGTGSNATLPLKLRTLHESKRPRHISMRPGENRDGGSVKIAVNTEWSIRGSSPPLRRLGLITRWDDELAGARDLRGFQPLEYMTAGRYLGELGRLIFLDYLTTTLSVSVESLPPRLLEKYGLDTTWLSWYRPPEGRDSQLLLRPEPPSLLRQLEAKFPVSGAAFCWTGEAAEALYEIARAIEVRAAGIVAAAIVGLLRVAEEIPPASAGGVVNGAPLEARELGVGYTGGCIVNFQNYRDDTQRFLDVVVRQEFGGEPPVRITLTPCHDGGIIGAGILCAAASL